MIEVKYRKYPFLLSKRESEKAYAGLLRGMYRQKYKEELEFVEEMIEDIDYKALQRTAHIFHISPDELLFYYFSWMGKKKEYLVITEEKAEEIIALLNKKVL